MLESDCCHSPTYMDTVDTGDRIGESICVKIVYKCQKCHNICGVVSWADAGTGGGHDEITEGV